MTNWIKKNYVYIISLFFISLFTFSNIKNVFYQQDEWHALGSYFAQNSFWDLFNVNFFKAILGEGRIFSSILGYFFLRNFPFENFPLALYGFILHFLNTLFVFALGVELIGKKNLAFISAAFFGVCSVSAGTVSWYSTSIGTLPATTLILLAVLLFWNGFNGKKSYFFPAYIALYISQPFKEIGYFLFLSLPLTAFLYQRLSIKSFLIKFWYYLVTFIVITVYRITQLSSYSSESIVFTQASSSNFIFTIVLRAIMYPFTSLSLVYIPPEFLIKTAKVFVNHYYPFFPSEHYNLIVESVVLDLLAITLSFLLIFTTLIISKKSKIQIQKNIIFTIVIIISSFLPYIILSKTYAYLDSRYYYMAAAFSGILFGFFILNLLSFFKNKYFKFTIVFLSVAFLIWHMQLAKADLNDLSKLSIERKSILSQLKQLKPTLTKRNVFLVIGDRHYYLAHDNYIPFQQGIGYTILVWLNNDNVEFRKLLGDMTLWELGSQGYFESGEGGFGYFWDEEKFKKIIDDKQLSSDEYTALYYNSKTGVLDNISAKYNREIINQ